MPRSRRTSVVARRGPVAALLLLGLSMALAAPAAGLADDEPTPDPVPPLPPAAAAEGAVVVIGVTGLRWEDVRILSTPGLWSLSRSASIAAVATRSVQSRSCPADGWLAVNTGARAADLAAADRSCRTLREPLPDQVIPGWADYLAAVSDQPYGAELGFLGDALADAEIPVTGIGPGAAIALADSSGTPVGTHLRRPGTLADLEEAVRQAANQSRLLVIDAGTIRDAGYATRARPEPQPGQNGGDELADDEEPTPSGAGALTEPTRLDQVRTVDARIEAVLRALRGSPSTVLLVSVADSGPAGLQLAMAQGPGPAGEPYGETLLSSGSTRQRGLVQTVDVTDTVLELLGVTAPSTAGAPIVPAGGPELASARLQRVQDITQEAIEVTRISGSFLTRLVIAQAILFAAAAVLLIRAQQSRVSRMRPVMRVLQVGALALGAAPVASFLVGLVPWWRAPAPVWGFWIALLAWIATITALALAGPWRRAPLGPAGVVAGVTVTVLVLDALVGSPLVIDAPMGAHRIMAARFYGMSNQAFAMVAAGGLLAAAAVAQPLLARGRVRAALAAVVGIGLVVTVVDGAPGLGSDFGGPPGLLLGFAVLGLAVSGRRVRWRTLLLVLAIAAVVVLAFAGLDWLRDPADRTHLGRFFADLVAGDIWDVLGRKVAVQLRVLTLWRYVVLAVGGILLTGLVVLGPHPRAGALLGGSSPLARLREAVPLLPATVAGIGLALGVGLLINDSGIVVPATGVAVAVPCLVAAAAQRGLVEPEGDPQRPGLAIRR